MNYKERCQTAELCLPVSPFANMLKKLHDEMLADLSKAKHNFCSRCGKRLGLESSIHTCTPPTTPTGWDNGLSQDYDKKLGAWFSEKPNAKEELRARMFDEYGNKLP